MAAEPRPSNLDPDPEEMRRLGYLAVDLAVDQLAALADAPVARRPQPEVLADLVREPLPRQGQPIEAARRQTGPMGLRSSTSPSTKKAPTPAAGVT